MDSMSIVQASTVLNSIYAQATGKTAPVATENRI